VRKLNGTPISNLHAQDPRLRGTFLLTSSEEWARGIEHKIDVGDHVPNAKARKRTLTEAIERYLEVTLPRAKHRARRTRREDPHRDREHLAARVSVRIARHQVTGAARRGSRQRERGPKEHSVTPPPGAMRRCLIYAPA